METYDNDKVARSKRSLSDELVTRCKNVFPPMQSVTSPEMTNQTTADMPTTFETTVFPTTDLTTELTTDLIPTAQSFELTTINDYTYS